MSDEAPRRLHPGSIAIGWLKSAPSTIIGLPAFFGYVSSRGLPWILSAIAVMAVVGLFFTWLRWRTFTYRIADGAVVIEQGILSRSRRSIPFERIQDVSIVQPLLARIFGLAQVRLETGASEKDEGELDSVSLAEAARLRRTLRGETTASPVDDQVASEPEALFAMGFGRLLLAGMFNFSLVWLAAIFGLFQYFDGWLDIDRETIERWIGLAEDEVRARISLQSVLLIAGATLALGVVSGVLRTVLRDFGFRLTYADGRFRRVRGLLTRTEVVVAASRVQLARVRRGAVSRWFGWLGLAFQTLGGSDDASGRQEMAPFASRAEVRPIIEAARLPEFDRLALRPVAAGHVVRAALRRGVPIAVVATAGAFLFPPLLFGLALIPFAIGWALLERRYHRYALTEAALQVTRGVLGQTEWLVPVGNIQGVSINQSLVQRWLGVATVYAGTAGASGFGGPYVHDLAEGDAVTLAQAILARIGDDAPSAERLKDRVENSASP